MGDVGLVLGVDERADFGVEPAQAAGAVLLAALFAHADGGVLEGVAQEDQGAGGARGDQGVETGVVGHWGRGVIFIIKGVGGEMGRERYEKYYDRLILNTVSSSSASSEPALLLFLSVHPETLPP